MLRAMPLLIISSLFTPAATMFFDDYAMLSSLICRHAAERFFAR